MSQRLPAAPGAVAASLASGISASIARARKYLTVILPFATTAEHDGLGWIAAQLHLIGLPSQRAFLEVMRITSERRNKRSSTLSHVDKPMICIVILALAFERRAAVAQSGL